MKSYIVILENDKYLAVQNTWHGEEAAVKKAGKEIVGYVTAKNVRDAIDCAIQFGYAETIEANKNKKGKK